MKEWNNPWNPFNSMKILMWREHLEHCANYDYLPPIMVDVDLSNRCNLRCSHCNAYDIIHDTTQDLSETHLMNLADFFKEWGVLSSCVSGGGESLMNPHFNKFLIRMHDNGIENGVITNGTLLTDEHIEVISKTCRWIGISVDASTSNTYMLIKGISNPNMFDKVLKNIEKLCIKVKQLKTNCDVSYKYLLRPENALEIYDAAIIAKNMGVRDFHLRPVGWDNISITKDKQKISFEGLTDKINEQVEKCLTLEDENFRFYGVRHKFNDNFTRKVNFKKCWTIPLLPTFAADGNVYLCFDMRGRKDLVLCKHTPDPREILKVWNTDFHKNMVKSIDPQKCPRCTFSQYNEAVENVILKDNMCRKFI